MAERPVVTATEAFLGVILHIAGIPQEEKLLEGPNKPSQPPPPPPPRRY